MSWTPQDISPSVWFDFSDSNMVTVESSRIVRVDDKVTSSTNYAWAPSTSLRPYTTTVNGLTAAYGAGTSVLEVGTPVLYGSNTMIFLVAKPSPANDTLKYVIAAPTSQTHGAFAILTNFVDPKPNFEFQDYAGGNRIRSTFDSNALDPDTSYLITVTGNTSNESKLYLNGRYHTTLTHSFVGEPLGGLFSINRGYSANMSKSTICELFSVADSNDTNREIAEWYLADKWGITLDSNHTYASSAPGGGGGGSDCNVTFDSNTVAANYELSFTPSSRNVSFDLSSTSKGARGLKNVILSSNVSKSGSATLSANFSEPTYSLTPPISNSRKSLKLAGLGLAIEATVSAFSNDQIAVTVEYDTNIFTTLGVSSVSTVKMYHLSSNTNEWEAAVTTSYDEENSTITGQFTSLSPIDLGVEKRQGIMEIRSNQLVVTNGQILVYNQP